MSTREDLVRQNLADHEVALAGKRQEPKPDVVALLGREAEHVQQEMAAADPQAGLADLKRRLKNPPPFVGYLVVGANFTLPKRTKTSWLYQPPSLFHGLGDAEVERDGFQAMAPDDPPKAIFKVTVTFERVEGGSRGR